MERGGEKEESCNDHGATDGYVPRNEASMTALSAPSDVSLRVPCYCEENVWRLVCRKRKESPKGSLFYVVFVSSSSQCVPMFYQKAAAKAADVCPWDYHVILLEANGNRFNVLDIDSRLPYPCPLREYLTFSFPKGVVSEQYSPLFRVVKAGVYLNHFRSDRMHMFQDGKWLATPPTYSCIEGSAHNGKSVDGSNLDEYRIMESPPPKKAFHLDALDEPCGIVVTTSQLLLLCQELSKENMRGIYSRR